MPIWKRIARIIGGRELVGDWAKGAVLRGYNQGYANL